MMYQSITYQSGSERFADVWDNDTICVICIDELLKNEITTTLHCGHKFHSNCLELWTKQADRNTSMLRLCPTCRQEYEATVLKKQNPNQEAELNTLLQEHESDINRRASLCAYTLAFCMACIIIGLAIKSWIPQ